MVARAVDDVWDDWKKAVNMTANELEDWLKTPESQKVGDTGSDGESTGHESGRHIVRLLRTNKSDLSEDDAAHMRKVVGYVHRHLAQRPDGDLSGTPWRHSLMNWGHDPLKR